MRRYDWHFAFILLWYNISAIPVGLGPHKLTVDEGDEDDDVTKVGDCT